MHLTEAKIFRSLEPLRVQIPRRRHCKVSPLPLTEDWKGPLLHYLLLLVELGGSGGSSHVREGPENHYE